MGPPAMIHEGGEQSLAPTAKVEKFHPNRHLRRDLKNDWTELREMFNCPEILYIQQMNYFSITSF